MQTRKKLILLIVAIVLLVLVSAGSTVLFKSGFFQGKQVLERSLTMTDAQMLCDVEVRNKLGARLKHLSVDEHSTRYDLKADRFKVFMIADIIDEDSEVTEPYIVYCFTRSDRLEMTDYDIVANKNEPSKAISSGVSQGGSWGYE